MSLSFTALLFLWHCRIWFYAHISCHFLHLQAILCNLREQQISVFLGNTEIPIVSSCPLAIGECLFASHTNVKIDDALFEQNVELSNIGRLRMIHLLEFHILRTIVHLAIDINPKCLFMHLQQGSCFFCNLHDLFLLPATIGYSMILLTIALNSSILGRSNSYFDTNRLVSIP